MISDELLILSSLVNNLEFTGKVLPYLKGEYFSDITEREVYIAIDSYIKEYSASPDRTAMLVIYNDSEWTEPDDARQKIKEIFSIEPAKDLPWLINQAEKFVQNKAVYNAIMKAIGVYDGSDSALSPLAIPEMIREAVSISFDEHIGMDLIDDALLRWEYYNHSENTIPFNINILNEITLPGIPRKTLNVIMAGCVHPDTEVYIKHYLPGRSVIKRHTKISEIKDLFAKGHKVEVDSPDGFVSVTDFVDKGQWQEHVLYIDGFKPVRCNSEHLFEVRGGWQFAKNLADHGGIHEFLTKDGWREGFVERTDNMIPIVDIQIDHPEHRYFTNGISSHNTNVGKSYFLISLASDYVRQGLKVLYISLEMREEEILLRMDANLLDIEIDKIRHLEQETYINRIQRLQNKSFGKLKVKEYPPGTSHTGHFRTLMKELDTRNGFKPDVVIVDYMGLMASANLKSGQAQPYYYLKEISVELRALAVEFDIIVWSAMQVNRGGLGSTDITLNDISESAGVAHTCDFMLGVMRTDELDSHGQLLAKQLKSRYQNKAKRTRFLLGSCIDKQQIYDVSDAEQRTIIQGENALNDQTIKGQSSQRNLKDRFAALNNV